MPALLSQPDTDQWISVLSVAEAKGVTRYRVMAAAAEGTLRGQRIAGRLCLWRADVERWNPAADSAPRAA
jgi:hypothetical protein